MRVSRLSKPEFDEMQPFLERQVFAVCIAPIAACHDIVEVVPAAFGLGDEMICRANSGVVLLSNRLEIDHSVLAPKANAALPCLGSAARSG